ncbi:MAG: SH3 domain-containing protein [Desulfobulbus sp.]|nr:SH3 domain-containing protein [Desulfobulbus sp.]
MHHRNLFTSVRACFIIAPLVLGLAGSLEAKSIGKDQVNIRSAPNLNSKIVFTVPLGYPIKVEKEADNWSFFHDWQNNTGWVYKPLISDIDTAVILVEKANIRSQANLKSKVAAIAEMGEIYTILGKEGNWVKLGYYHGGSELGWIRDDLVFGD